MQTIISNAIIVKATLLFSELPIAIMDSFSV